jgi:predicted Zn-dependent protease
VALPLDGAKVGVPPEREPAYVAGYWETAKLIDGADVATARARLGELAAAFPSAPGVEVLTCDLELKARHLTPAAKHCEAALDAFKGATRAHILLAVIAFTTHRGPVGEQHLRQAIRLDPDDPTGWRVLGQFYRSTRATRQLAALNNEHEQLLSSPLPE